MLLLALAHLLGIGPCLANDEPVLRAALDRLAGSWTGEVQVKAMDGFVLKSLEASRSASWEGETLRIETTLRDGSGDYVVTARHAIRLGRLESTVSRPGQPEDRFLGEASSDALVWTNAEGNRRDAREVVSERGGDLVLETSSVEPMRALGLSGLVRLEGRFRRPAPPATADAPVAVVSDDVGRALAEERRAAALLRTQLAETEARLAEAEARAAAPPSDPGESARLRARITELESDRESLKGELDEARRREQSAAAGAEQRRNLEERLAGRDEELAAVAAERDALRERVATLESTLAAQQREQEQIAATQASARAAPEARMRELEARLAQVAAVPPAAGISAGSPESHAAAVVSREQLAAQVQHMERRALEHESERNAAREQLALVQRQLEETRRLRDDTLLRFQAVVGELNALREEKERLARANVSLQAEVRSAQLASRAGGGSRADSRGAGAEAAAPATTFDGRTADMVIAALQIIGVTRGEEEDKVILDGRVYRNGDLVEAQLGISFLRVEGDALVFQDRRGREYRRRF